MQFIEWADCAPALWRPEALPEVDDVRPHCCPRCGCHETLGAVLARLEAAGRFTRANGLLTVPRSRP